MQVTDSNWDNFCASIVELNNAIEPAIDPTVAINIHCHETHDHHCTCIVKVTPFATVTLVGVGKEIKAENVVL